MNDEQFKSIIEYLKNIQSNTTNSYADKTETEKETLDQYKNIMTSLGSLIAEVNITTDELKKAKEAFLKGSKNIDEGFKGIESNVVKALENPVPKKKLTWRDRLGMIFKKDKKNESKETTTRKS